MNFKKIGDIFIIRLSIGEEIIACMNKFCADEGVKLATITGIGAAEFATVAVYNVKTKKYAHKSISRALEITALNGNVTTMDGKPYIHLHASFSDEDGGFYGGHLKEALVGATCEIFIKCIHGSVDRSVDEATGLNLMVL